MGNVSIEGKYYFAGDEWFFKNQYSDNLNVPDDILCEIMIQTSYSLLRGIESKIPYLVSFTNVKFLKRVCPGDNCKVTAKLINKKGPLLSVRCRIYVYDDLCTESEMVFIRKKY